MSLTYSNEPKPYAERVEPVEAAPVVPVYARKRASRDKGGVKTWMILVPVGLLTLGGIGAALMMGGGEEAAGPTLSEPAATLPVIPATPLTPPVAPAPAVVTVDTADTPPAVAVREQAPARVAAAAPARRATAPAASAPARIQTPAPVTSPQPFAMSPVAPVAGPSASTPAPTPTLPVEPREPAIATEPF